MKGEMLISRCRTGGQKRSENSNGRPGQKGIQGKNGPKNSPLPAENPTADFESIEPIL
jgi:hypothetical protein